jgi:glycosyltransferase involved in cell wall biosynthesis
MNKRKQIFIIVPSAVMDSPIKGAVALANELCKTRRVTFVTLKAGSEAYRLLNDDIERVSLGQLGWVVKLYRLRRLLREAGGKDSVIAISSSFSADFFNSLCRDLAVTCCSVRANLPIAYRMTYGWLGGWLAYFHLKRMRYFDYVVSMTTAMSEQVQCYTGKSSPVIGNFIDEDSLEKFRKKVVRQGAYRFVFTGSMTERKQPQLLLDALCELKRRGAHVRLDCFGDGSLLKELKDRAVSLQVSDLVCFHGYVDEPYRGLTDADVLVLPSLSEGVSRAVLEALYLGVPCVLRDVDGNSELISDKINGGLFNRNEDLADIMLRTAEWSRKRESISASLLPPSYRQSFSVKAYLSLVENNND